MTSMNTKNKFAVHDGTGVKSARFMTGHGAPVAKTKQPDNYLAPGKTLKKLQRPGGVPHSGLGRYAQPGSVPPPSTRAQGRRGF